MTATRPTAPPALLEREGALETLGLVLAESEDGAGRVVLLAGEAGIGKTALVRQFCEARPPTIRLLAGTCDTLFTPRPLGPFLDVANTTGGDLHQLLAGEARPHEVAAALLGTLQSRPTILVLEDLHRADEATLDVVRLVSRRIARSSVLVLITYRDDELDRGHPLRMVLGELVAQPEIVRIRLEPLSLSGVSALAGASNIDVDDLYRRTGGNPFFVTEVLAAEEETVPPTVRDAVLARAAHLTAEARRLLEVVAVLPPQAELWLLAMLAENELEQLEECLGSGMLVTGLGSVAFRHELARIAFEESLAPTRRMDLHRSALEALAKPPNGEPDLARLAHHAEAAGDSEAVIRYAPAAAERAASLGAHREAAAHYARALRFGERVATPETRAAVLEGIAYEDYVIGELAEALAAQRRALDVHRRLGDRLREGDAVRSLSRLLRYVGRSEEAMDVGREAVTVLEGLPPGRELGMAYCNVSHLFMHREDLDATCDWGDRALDLAARFGDAEIEVYARTNIGNVEMLHGRETDNIERSLRLAQDAGLEEHAGRAFVSLTWWSHRGRLYTAADRYIDEGLEYCTDRGLDLWRGFLLAARARTELDRGRWGDAVESVAPVLQDPRHSPVPRITVLAVLGLVRARRGDPDVWAALDEARALAASTGELQRLEPVALAQAEAHWLQNRGRDVASATDEALQLALDREAWWIVGELSYWRRRAGTVEEIPAETAEPWHTQIAGDWERAAELWTELDAPYETALALSEAHDEAALRRALEIARELGARPLASIVTRRLRELGANGVPRGPRASTRENPARLTARELEVLRLLAEGLRNAEIAERLVVSRRTVDHHVSAILRKLEARTRVEAVTAAGRLSLLQDP